MTFRGFILGLFLFQCVVYTQCGGKCVIPPDPNGYFDDLCALENGFFECGDPNNLTPYGTIYDFEPPVYWKRIPHEKSSIWNSPVPSAIDCYAALHSSFDPKQNHPQTEVGWKISTPYEGETFVLLSTGGFDDVNDVQIKGSTIYQKVFLNEGDVILGAYFLGTVDYPYFNDYGRIYAQLEPNYVYPCPEPNELVINGGFDSDTSWEITGSWTITDPNNQDPNFIDSNIAAYNLYQQPIDPNIDCTLSQTVPLVPHANYRVSIDVLTGEFDSGSDAFTVTLGNETHNMIADANTTITQLFTPLSGNALTISWNNEGTINIDNVSVRCTDHRPVDEFVIIYKALGTEPNDIPKEGSTVDWIEFQHIVEPNQAGPYVLYCEVVDEVDTILSTYLAVDGLRICRGGKPLSDLNNDCVVNLIDYSILSEAWLSFCPDPPFYDPNFYDPNDWPPPITDPNIPCQLADIDNSWFVDPNDLIYMSGDWLKNNSEPNNF